MKNHMLFHWFFVTFFIFRKSFEKVSNFFFKVFFRQEKMKFSDEIFLKFIYTFLTIILNRFQNDSGSAWIQIIPYGRENNLVFFHAKCILDTLNLVDPLYSWASVTVSNVCLENAQKTVSVAITRTNGHYRRNSCSQDLFSFNFQIQVSFICFAPTLSFKRSKFSTVANRHFDFRYFKILSTIFELLEG